MAFDPSTSERLFRDLTEPEPIPEAGIARAVALMRSGRLFRYGEMGTDQHDAALFEQEFAALVGRSYCIGVNSGGAALFLALKAAGVQPGDDVLVNGFTLAPVPGAILHAAARPVIVEITADFTIDLDDLREKARNSDARILLLSHMRGHLADMDAVVALCAELRLTLIEDCAHALLARWKGRQIGSFGALAAFSAQTYKHLNAGEGGCVTLDDPAMAARIILHSGSYMLHGQHLARPDEKWLEDTSETTPNFSMRMSALAAAMLRPQLAELPRRITRWRAIHARIAAGLVASNRISIPAILAGAEPSPTSIQFILPGFSAAQMVRFLDFANQRGLPIKWFGAARQAGFTSAPRNWLYAGEQGPLARTHDILSTLCDIRTPVSLDDRECDLIGRIVRECAARAAEEPPFPKKFDTATQIAGDATGAGDHVAALRN